MRNGTRLGRLIVAAAMAIGVGAPPAGAAEPLPVGEAFGVRISPQGRDMTVVFTREARALARRISGRRISVWCEHGDKGVGEYLEVARGQTRMRLRNLAPGNDYCRILLEPRRMRRGRATVVQSEPETLVSIPLTQAGAVQLDEELRALMLWGIVNLPPTAGEKGFATPQQLLARMRTSPGAPIGIVALANPTDLPPADDVGYWSDGAQHALVVTVSATGRRMFVELLPGQEVRTNVLTLYFAAAENF